MKFTDTERRGNFLREVLNRTLRSAPVIRHDRYPQECDRFQIDGWLEITGSEGDWRLKIRAGSRFPHCLRALHETEYRMDSFWKVTVKVGLLCAHLEIHRVMGDDDLPEMTEENHEDPCNLN